ncbi:bifunctional acetate--CoA ligase family protein/GNAT family N-acetyltransferase [Fodinicurvata sediminis]|uniref:bifunctional acetate--CoA ligase family protein/GNAT family N-acetyltransferase n=1 Tax=Fodinicurvata sediminis TaxID=1121832 RepID=UPI0003B36262|nr:bifunctional acetate--CoA ligase family protein/GNAT family N-acetyltransferase [Fodinicurvata sediminis]
MTTRNLESFFHPRSVALIGASGRKGSVGHFLARNLFHSGFQGPIMPVNPRRESIEGVLAYPSVASLPRVPDLAIICTPPETVPDLTRELAERGTKAVVVVTAGFGEGGQETGHNLRQAMLSAARPHTLRVVGPNCVGLLAPHQGLNASFAHQAALPGDMAFVTQSGAIVTAMLDWATGRGIGFSHVVSLGDMADVDFGDMLDYLAVDPQTRAVMLYVEAVTDARKFMSAARACARIKPVIVIKGGRNAEAAKAATSHTGALAGADEVYDAAFRRAGVLRVFTLEELFDAVQTLATSTPLRHGDRDRLAILTNGGGLGVLATDALIEHKGHLAELSDETMQGLEAALPPTWSHGNPVDIVGDADPERYRNATQNLLEDKGVDALLVMHCPVAVADPNAVAESVIETVQARPSRKRKPIFTAWLGDQAVAESRSLFAESHIPTYDTPERAVRGFMHLVRYRRGQEELMETPASLPDEKDPDRESVQALLEEALAEGREWLSEPEAKALLSCYGVATVETRKAADPDEAVRQAEEIGFPVALKILSPDITHKSDVGGVKLDLANSDRVRIAAEEMLKRVRQARPEAQVDGFSVQAMCRRPGAQELILGLTEDRQFGPVILFGEGGTAVEVIRDKAVGLPPLNMTLAHSLMAETRIHDRLKGYRAQAPADLDAIAAALMHLSQIAAERPEVREIDINPLLADEKGVIALDARVRLMPRDAVDNSRGPAYRLAIRPYPRLLEQWGHLMDGTEIFMRPIRPEDEPALNELYKHLTPDDVRMRFFSHMAELSHESAARFTQIDYNREMALVAISPENPEDLWGVVRIAADPENERAEYAVAVRSDIKGRGLGYLLMRRILDYAARRGIQEVWGDVLSENARMLQLVKDLGFDRRLLAEDTNVVRVSRKLEPAKSQGKA